MADSAKRPKRNATAYNQPIEIGSIEVTGTAIVRILLGFFVLIVLVLPASCAAKPITFELQFTKQVSEKPFTGRVFVLLSKREPRGLPNGLSWGSPAPSFAKDVKDWKPGELLKIDGNAMAYPIPLDKLEAGTWYAQAVMDFENGISFAATPGNIYSKTLKLELGPNKGTDFKLLLDQVYEAPEFNESARVKEVVVEIKLLSDFFHKPIRMKAAVILPKSFSTDKAKKYPVIYEIPGFGGTHDAASRIIGRNPTEVAGTEMLYVVLDPSCPLGHHVFADSENNGPRGKALIEELIPAIEQKYRGIGDPKARFVTGHSSGGWSSLWLQVAYPDFFGGVWSTAPDPVDFRDFQMIDIYKDDNMFIDPAGKQRPLSRSGLMYKPFSDMEIIMGHGGQLASFEAVFSPKGTDGKPKKLWDRTTGKIDRSVAKDWEKYDIHLVLERNWPTLEPKLKGKLHVYMGDQDTFYLEGATRLLGESLKKLGSDAKVELFPGRNHGTLVDPKLRERIAKEMAEQFK